MSLLVSFVYKSVGLFRYLFKNVHKKNIFFGVGNIEICSHAKNDQSANRLAKLPLASMICIFFLNFRADFCRACQIV